MTPQTYELHPLCVLFPRMVGADFDALRDDIRANGLRMPIVLHDGMILDGGNRYRACIEAGVEPHYVPFGGGNLTSFVLSVNMHRRHMSPGQQAAIVASAQDWASAQTVGNPAFKAQSGNVAGLQTVAQRAAESGASERTQRMADKVAKADPELAVKVAHGEVSLPAAHATVVSAKKKPAKKKPAKKKPATPKPVAIKPAPTAPDAAPDRRDEHIKDLSDELDELKQTARELLADNVSMSSVFDADDKLAAALAENKRLRAEVTALRERVNSLVGEGTAHVRHIKSLMAKLKKAGLE